MTAAAAHRAADTTVVLATRNAGKVRELRSLLAQVPELAHLEVLGAGDLDGVPEVAETGVTFEENASLKSAAVAAATGLPAIADDSGLIVDVLGAAPGVWSAMWSGRAGDDQANIDVLQGQLHEVPVERLTAYFTSVVVLTLPDGARRAHSGRVDGRLTRDQRGSNGFGYDPIFELPDGRTLAEYSDAEKNAISHRGNAFRALVPDLIEVLGRLYDAEGETGGPVSPPRPPRPGRPTPPVADRPGRPPPCRSPPLPDW